MYNQYRQQMAVKIKSMIKPEHRRILCVGDALPEIEASAKENGLEFVQLENISPDWREISREHPHLDNALPAKHFDLLLVYHALEQAIEPERLMLELRKAVQPEGQTFITAYNIGHISTIINLLTEGWSYQDDGALRHQHVRYFSNESLRHLMDMVGFEFIDEVVYQMVQTPVLTRQLSQMMKNPYLGILSFIMIGRKINSFPFIDFEDDAEKEPPPRRTPQKKSSGAQ